MNAKILLVVFFTFIVISGFSQKIDKHKIEFDYIKLPKKPLDKSIKNYSSQVILAYEEDITARKQKAQDDYEQALADHPQNIINSKTLYDEEMARYDTAVVAWKNKSFGSKLVEKQMLDENNKPVKPGKYYPPSKPYLEKVYHQKIFNKNMLASTYLNLEGYNNSPEEALIITATLYGFENLEVELKSKAYITTNSSTKQKTETTNYWYEVSYKHPINLKITTYTGEVIIDETFEEFNEYRYAKSKESKGNTSGLNKDRFLQGLQNTIVEKNMKIIDDYINENYGYTKTTRNTIIFRVEPKKHNYDDYQKAFEFVAAGYSLLLSDNTAAIEQINNAIQIWEKAMLESDPSNKKARINSDITIITLLDLAEAYFWVNDFSNSDRCLNKIIGLKPSKKKKKRIENYRSVLKEQKERWEANQ
ncbi:MAG: hypothetical protein DRI84_06645 [Bacteroidetes bacterium]|nr:MAG: hypothetical protein DRI84_06645 [Bacteroidota bacterium]